MNAKINRVNNDIEKSKGKIAAEQTRLRELEKQKTELENLEIVSAVRGTNISFADLAQLLKQANTSIPGLSALSATSGQLDPKSEEQSIDAVSLTPSSYNNDNNNEEDSD